MRNALLVMALLGLAACTTSTQIPSTQTSSTRPSTLTNTPSTGPSPKPLLPRSKYADGCVQGNMMWRQKFFKMLTTAMSESQDNAEELRRIIYFLQLNGGGMMVEDRERGGPVLFGDDCLAGAAGSLSLMSSVLPHGPLLDQVLEKAARYYRELVRVYPDSKYADDARKFLSTV